jgi:hypothetical protein
MYEKCIVLYADILGFSNIISNETISDVEIYEILNKFGMPFFSRTIDSWNTYSDFGLLLDQIESNKKKILEYGKKDDDVDVDVFETENGRRKCSIFSDNVLCSYNLKGMNKKSINACIRDEIMRLVDVIEVLIERKILFRGGIDVGNLYHGSKTVFGPALIKTYEIESKMAIYPRICLSKCLGEYIENMPFSDVKREIIYAITNIDGQYFIDHLKYKILEWVEATEKMGRVEYFDQALDSYLIKHIEYINLKLAKCTTDEYYYKIAWLKQYHNRTVLKFSEPFKKNELDINKYLIA